MELFIHIIADNILEDILLILVDIHIILVAAELTAAVVVVISTFVFLMEINAINLTFDRIIVQFLEDCIVTFLLVQMNAVD